MITSHDSFRPRLFLDCSQEQYDRYQKLFSDRRNFNRSLRRFAEYLMDKTEEHGEIFAATIAHSDGDIVENISRLIREYDAGNKSPGA